MKAGGLLLLAPLLAAIAFSWARLIAESDDVPRDEDYLAAKVILADPGVAGGPFDLGSDALVILPPWSLRPLTLLGDLSPLSGDAIADRPMHRWARLWAIVEPDADDERDALIARRGAPTFSLSAGRLKVERWELPAPTVTYDLAARLAEASVRTVGESVAACDRPVRRGDVVGWACAHDGLRATREHVLVSENGDFAVFAAPPARGTRLEVSWPSVPVGSAVVVTAGLTREGANLARTPVRLRVLIDGTLAGTVQRVPSFLFATEVIDTSRFAGSAASVTFAIDSDNDSQPGFAFDAVVVR